MIQLEERHSEACLISLIVVNDLIGKGHIVLDDMFAISIHGVTAETIKDTIDFFTDIKLLNEMEKIENESSEDKQEG